MCKISRYNKYSFKKLIQFRDVPYRMTNQSIRLSCMMCKILILHGTKNTFDAFYINRNCSLSLSVRIRICRRSDPINISTRLLSRIMNSARLCIREMRGFGRFHIGGHRRYISSLGTYSLRGRHELVG